VVAAVAGATAVAHATVAAPRADAIVAIAPGGRKSAIRKNTYTPPDGSGLIQDRIGSGQMPA
jgi:hypothetical protein